MAKINVKSRKTKEKVYTHEGALAESISAEKMLRRSVMSCLLWENTFYENGVSIADRIASLIPLVDPDEVAQIAIDAREKFKLRHIPLFIVREMARHGSHKHLVADTLARVIQRADELCEYLSIYFKDGKCPISAQSKKGLARAFEKFSEYDFSKYNQKNAIKLRDVFFLVHGRTSDTYKKTKQISEGISTKEYSRGVTSRHKGSLAEKLVTDTLATPDTWEVAISAVGSDLEKKRKAWEKLLKTEKLGALALIRNLRNFTESGVDKKLVRKALSEMSVERVLPYRFISAARYAPVFEPELEEAMFKCIENMEKLSGETALVIDVSGSMEATLAEKSEMTRLDAACGLAILLLEICEKITVYTFSEKTKLIASRRGFALRDAIDKSQDHSSTYLGDAISYVNEDLKYDRLIVLTDEQSHDEIVNPKYGRGYLINVSPEKNGVGYGPHWTHIDGFSEAVVNYIQEIERE